MQGLRISNYYPPNLHILPSSCTVIYKTTFSFLFLLKRRSLSLPLNFIHKIKISRIKFVNPYISIFTTTSVPCSLGMYCYCVQRSKVASDSTDFVFKDFMVEACFEFSLTGLSGGYIPCFLTSSEDDLS